MLLAAAFLPLLCASPVRAEGPVVLAAPPAAVQPAPAVSPAAAPPATVGAVQNDAGDFSAFDFVVGGNNYGIVYGHFAANWFQADKPEDFLAVLPSVQDNKAFKPLFEGRIEKERTIPGVGTIKVDNNHFKITLDIAQEQSLVTGVEKLGELQVTDTNFSVRNHMFVAGSASTNTLDFSKNTSVTHETVLSEGRSAFESSGTLTQKSGYLLQSMLARRDFSIAGNDMMGSAGFLETAAPLHFAKSLNYTGLRLESNKDILFRDRQQQGSNIEIFLPHRSKVEVYRNGQSSGQILFSRILDFGTVQIDTREFPEGSYNIEIVISDEGGGITRETRPFTKTQALAPRGKPIIDVEAGTVRSNLSPSGTELGAFSYRRRLMDWLDGSIGAAATRDDQVYETSLHIQRGFPLFRYIGLLDISLTGAVSQQGKPAGMESSVGWSGEGGSLLLSASKTYARAAVGGREGILAMADRQAVDVALSAPITLYDRLVEANFSGEVSSSVASGSHYRYGPALSYTMDNIGNYTPNLKFEYVATDQDKRALLTLNVRSTNDSVWTKSAEIATNSTGSATTSSVRADLAFAGAQSGYTDWRKNLDASMNLRSDPFLATANAGMTVFAGSQVAYNAQYVKLLGFFDQNLTQMTGQVGGEVQNTVLWSGGKGFSSTPAAISLREALMVVQLKGAPGVKLAVTINGTTRAYGSSGDTVIVTLPIYVQSRVSTLVQDGAEGTYHVNENEHVVVGFPGNVIYREFNIMKTFFMMGALVDETGKPLANERFTMEGRAYYADDRGQFTMDTPLAAGAENRIQTSDRECHFVVAQLPPGDGIVDTGNITCRKKN